MEHNKIKLLSAAIMLSGLLSVTPAMADEPSEFPIEVKDAQTINGGGYSQKTSGVYKVIKGGSLELLPIDTTQPQEQSIQFLENKTEGNGASINVEKGGKLIVNQYDFNDNEAVNGGAIYAELKNIENAAVEPLNISNSTFTGNKATENGGAINFALTYEDDNTNIVTSTITQTTFSKNTAKNGGAIYSEIGNGNKEITLNFDGNVYESNIATENGGAINLNFLGAEKVFANITSNEFTSNSAKNGGAIYANVQDGNQTVNLNVTDNTFKSNVASENGGAIYAVTSGNGTIVADVSRNTFTENKAVNGGAVYVNNTNLNEKSAFLLFDNQFNNNVASKNGGAIAVDSVASEKPLLLQINNSTFEENEAQGLGGAIYASNADVQATDTDFLNNKAQNGSAIYAEDITIVAENKDVTISGNNGYALVSTGGTIDFDAANGKTITVDDNILASSSNEVAGLSFSNAGTYKFNGRIDLSSPIASGFEFVDDASGATVELGEQSATGTYSIIQEVNNVTLNLQNEHAGDTITVPYIISNSASNTMNIKIDYDVMANAIDNLVIGSNEIVIGDQKKGEIAQNVKFDLENIVVLNDDETWGSDELKDTTRQIRYLTAGSDVVNNTTTKGSYVSDDGVTYTFTVDENDKGLLNVTRTEDGMTLEDAIADDNRKAYTIRRGDYVLADESTGLGTLNKNKTEFEINGQDKYSLDGNNKDGIVVSNALDNDQHLYVGHVKEIRNFKTAITNEGKLTIENVTFVDNEKDIVNAKNADIDNSTMNGIVENTGIMNLRNSVINNDVKNNGTLNVLEASKVKNISDGKGTLVIGYSASDESEVPTNLVFDSENGIVQDTVTINEKGSLEIYADKLKVSNGVTNNNILTLKGQDGQENTQNDNTITGDGTTNIEGSVQTTKKISSKYIVVKEDSSLYAKSANFIGSDVTNNGEVTLNMGTLGNKINGGKLTLENTVTTNADNLLADEIVNDGTLTLTGGTVSKNIDTNKSTSKTVINNGSTVTNEAQINQKIEVNQNAKYITSADNIYDVDGSIKTTQATIELNGGTLKEKRIQGSGNIEISNTVKFDFDNSEADTKVLQNITLNEDATFVPFATYTGSNNNITAKNGSTIDLMNDTVQEVNFKKLTIADGNVFNVKADYLDTLNSQDVTAVNGKVNISALDLSKAEDSYVFTTTLADKVTFKPDEIKMNETLDKNAVYYTKVDGKINLDKIDGLTAAVQKVIDDGNDLAYLMKSNEELTEEKTLTGADMTILGNGNTITGKPLTVETNELNIVDANIANTSFTEDNKYSLTLNKATLNIKAKDNDVVVAGPIQLKSDAGANSKLAFIANENKQITLNDEIKSNNVDNTVYFNGNGTIVANGIFDPFTAEVNTNLVKNNYDYEITYNVNNGGVLKYTNDKYLYENDNHGTVAEHGLNTINLNGGTLDLMNGVASTISLAGFNVNADSNLMLDVDLANRAMDKIDDATPMTVGGNLNITKLNLISDATGEETTINFTTNDALKEKVQYVGEREGLIAKSPIYRYNVGYKADSGDFSFTRSGGYEGFNPAVYGSAVAMQGLYYTQLNNYNVALANVDQTMLKTKAQRNAEKYGNKYAYDGDETQVFSPLYVQEKNAGAWFKPYVSTERVNLKDGPDVDNTMYGALFGGDSDVITVGGWDTQYSVYAGYNGSHQAFDGNEIYQNGGVLGLTATAYKGNFFTALTANVGMHGANIKTDVGNNDLNTLTTGVASKTGYNWELADGKFIIQPSWLMSYTFINPFDDYTLGNGVRIKNDSLHALQLAPGLKFIGNTANGWQPYLGAQMVWNIVDDTKVKANEVNLPETSTKAYVEYGVGVQKSAGERFTGFGQAMVRNGGRTGVVFTLGGRWAIGTLDR